MLRPVSNSASSRAAPGRGRDRGGTFGVPVRVGLLTPGLATALAGVAIVLAALAGGPSQGTAARAVLDGHAGLVWSLAFSADGRTLLACGLAGALARWDIGTGRARVTALEPAGSGGRLAFAPVGATLAYEDDARAVI